MSNKIYPFIKKIVNVSYLKSLTPYIIIAFILFIVGAVTGYYFSNLHPSRAQDLISLLEEMYSSILKESKLSQILFILLKNGFVSFLAIVLGILFGFFPFVALINNGQILGMLANIVFRNYGVFYFFAGILPHGIIEIPCFLVSSAIGLKIGRTVIKKVLRKEVSIIRELNCGLRFFLVLLVFLFIAAVIETLITPELLRIY